MKEKGKAKIIVVILIHQFCGGFCAMINNLNNMKLIYLFWPCEFVFYSSGSFIFFFRNFKIKLFAFIFKNVSETSRILIYFCLYSYFKLSVII